MKPPTPLKLDLSALEAAFRTIEDITPAIQLYAGYGRFMATWAQFEAILEVAIMRETKMDTVAAIIVCSGLGFERKASIARSLLALGGDANKPPIALINKICQDAERNALIHGLANVQKQNLELFKRDTAQKLTIKVRELDGESMQAKVSTLQAQLEELKRLLLISEADLKAYENTTRSLVSN